VNGKMRGKIELSADAQKEEAVAAALGNEKISKFLPLETSIKKVIFVPGKVLNIVAK
jgi:leucyl-tRNA synthetase